MNRRTFLKAVLAVAGAAATPIPEAALILDQDGKLDFPKCMVRALDGDGYTIQRWMLAPEQIVRRSDAERPFLTGRLTFEATEILPICVSSIVMDYAGKVFVLWNRSPIFMVMGDTLTVEE